MTDRPELTKAELRTLEELRKFIATEGFPPTVRDLAVRLNLNSHSTAAVHLRKLAEKGYIERLGSRAIRIVYHP